MLERSAHDLGVSIPERDNKNKKNKTKKSKRGDAGEESNADLTRSMRRFMEVRARQQNEQVTTASNGDDKTLFGDAISPEQRFASARRQMVESRARSMTGKATNKIDDVSRKGEGSGSVAPYESQRNEQQQQQQQQKQLQYAQNRTNRQFKRRAFEKKKRVKKRTKRLGIETFEYDDEDDEYAVKDDTAFDTSFMSNKQKAMKAVSERGREEKDHRSSLFQVNSAPPSIKRKPITKESIVKNFSKNMRKSALQMKL